ncbi:MAG: hypothetical protein HY670_04565 [Chloroflexi bacterium]|nr:hypothetical protein [Chloroflexota bacterium]
MQAQKLALVIVGVVASIAAFSTARVAEDAKVTAANEEVANVKVTASSYFAGTGSYPADSDLLRDYLSGKVKAKYTFAGGSLMVSRVDAVPGGWTNIVFNITRQKWQSGFDEDGIDGNLDIRGP